MVTQGQRDNMLPSKAGSNLYKDHRSPFPLQLPIKPRKLLLTLEIPAKSHRNSQSPTPSWFSDGERRRRTSM